MANHLHSLILFMKYLQYLDWLFSLKLTISSNMQHGSEFVTGIMRLDKTVFSSKDIRFVVA